MTELWLLVLIPILAWALARQKVQRAVEGARSESAGPKEALELCPTSSHGVTGSQELSNFVVGLAEDFEQGPKVTALTMAEEATHVWNSPSGQRVYIN